MPNAKDEGVTHSDTDTWSSAKGFAFFKILEILRRLDYYETMAQFGSVELDSISMSQTELSKSRKEGLYRLSASLRQLINNTRFAYKKEDHALANSLLERLDVVDGVMDGITTVSENLLTHEFTILINEAHFTLCFKVLVDVKTQVNYPLNKAGLIFRESEDIDLDKIQREIIEGG